MFLKRSETYLLVLGVHSLVSIRTNQRLYFHHTVGDVPLMNIRREIN